MILTTHSLPDKLAEQLTFFDDFSSTSKIWVFQASCELQPEEALVIYRQAKSFTAKWTAHGSPIKAKAQVFFNYFLIVGVDEVVTQVSGCATDKLMHFVQEMEKQFTTSFFNRTKIALWKNERISFHSFQEIRKKVKMKSLNSEVYVFNNTVSTLKQLRNSWLLPVYDSFLNR